MKNKEIVAFFNAKQSLKNKKLPMKLAFALKLNYERLQTHADAYNEQFLEIREKYENKEEKQEVFLKEIEELLDIDVSCDVQTVGFDTLEQCDRDQFDNLTVGELEILSFMISG